MATVTVFTAARMAAIEAASIVSGAISGDNLILTKFGGGTVNAGNVRGPAGPVASVTTESWHIVNNAGEPPFVNSWINYDATRIARFKKYPDGRVRLTGVIKNGTVGQAAFILPVGYRPSNELDFGVNSGNAFGNVAVLSDGTVALNIGVNGLVSLDGIEFDTGQTTFPAGKSIVPVVTTLPSTPSDGDEIYLQTAAMLTDGIMWNLRYVASDGKWQFLGGGPQFVEDATGITMTGTAYSTPTTGTTGPSITVPVLGDYYVDFGSDMYQTTGGVGSVGLAVGAATPTIGISYGGLTSGVHGTRSTKLSAVAAGTVLSLKYKTTANTLNADGRWLKVTPKRLG